MTTPDAREIAAGLSPSKRNAMLAAEADGNLGKLFIRWWQAKGRTLRSIRNQGLGFTVWSGVCLTPLGQQVAAILKGERDG